MTDRLPKPPPVPLAEVKWRPQGNPAKDRDECQWVAYVDAAIVAELLDEWVGPGMWSDEYKQGTIDGKEVMWCKLSILVGDQWVSHTDVGLPSDNEGQKGAVSDAFKRAACLKWGVGRNVYKLPQLWAPARVVQGKAKGKTKDTDTVLLDKLRRAGFRDAVVSADGDTEEAAETAVERPQRPAAPSGGESGTRPRRDAQEGRKPAEAPTVPNMAGAMLAELKGRDAKQAVDALREDFLWPIDSLEADPEQMARAVAVLTPFVEEAKATA